MRKEMFIAHLFFEIGLRKQKQRRAESDSDIIEEYVDDNLQIRNPYRNIQFTKNRNL